MATAALLLAQSVQGSPSLSPRPSPKSSPSPTPKPTPSPPKSKPPPPRPSPKAGPSDISCRACLSWSAAAYNPLTSQYAPATFAFPCDAKSTGYAVDFVQGTAKNAGVAFSGFTARDATCTGDALTLCGSILDGPSAGDELAMAIMADSWTAFMPLPDSNTQCQMFQLSRVLFAFTSETPQCVPLEPQMAPHCDILIKPDGFHSGPRDECRMFGSFSLGRPVSTTSTSRGTRYCAPVVSNGFDGSAKSVLDRAELFLNYTQRAKVLSVSTVAGSKTTSIVVKWGAPSANTLFVGPLGWSNEQTDGDIAYFANAATCAAATTAAQQGFASAGIRDVSTKCSKSGLIVCVVLSKEQRSDGGDLQWVLDGLGVEIVAPGSSQGCIPLSAADGRQWIFTSQDDSCYAYQSILMHCDPLPSPSPSTCSFCLTWTTQQPLMGGPALPSWFGNKARCDAAKDGANSFFGQFSADVLQLEDVSCKVDAFTACVDASPAGLEALEEWDSFIGAEVLAPGVGCVDSAVSGGRSWVVESDNEACFPYTSQVTHCD
ncbi:hypothetical protein HYH03_013662 [Edaphochlamys debaryana]|uniref:Uncharacterized protein n=1 Tax=Edaphochlamys debaryana TaxID=47281 RepID=A0A835XPH3_9CHLO|nr:hypothetical protein HYH03_013662 [Edaphochlamys debaryana]|eukprot:KAG2487818.1 hypothetical protein HYH03_013662 [Edaphochlamys debaryana]